jgi:hypothetical protein
MASNQKICKHHVLASCRNGDKCNYLHVDNICRNYFKGNCVNGDKCKFIHEKNTSNSSGYEYDKPIPTHTNKSNKSNKTNKSKKNTESFEPWYMPSDMRVLIAHGDEQTYQNNIEVRDVILVPNLFCDEKDYTIYQTLLSEIEQTGLTDIFKEWHGDTHLIADDHAKWKNSCATFNLVVEKLAKYFNLDVKATRFNFYKDATHFKPFHFDAAAIDPQKAKTQNITVGVSFGCIRDAEFEHAKNRTTIKFPQPNGYVYVFGRDVNINWRHGITPIPVEKQENFNGLGRISIIAWGYTNQTEV